MTTRTAHTLLVCLTAVLFASACDRSRTPEIGPQDARWSALITHHTSGTISRREKIRVVFANDVVGPERVGQRASGVVAIDPSLDGDVIFSRANEILVVPSADLPPGSAFRIRVSAQDLNDIPADLGRFEFAVTVMEQDLEVELTGLSPDSADNAGMVLRGTLVTADVEEADRVERVLTATYRNETMPVRWQHGADGRRHQFSVPGIARQQETGEVRVAWDGTPIGVSLRREGAFPIPALNVFTVTDVAGVQEDRQYVVVHFSDSLDPRQNLRGLIRFSGGGFTSSVEANTIRLLPTERLIGQVTVTLEPGIRSAQGNRLDERIERVVTYASDKPQVRFVGSGVVLPPNEVLSVPVEAVNVHSVQVTAFRVFETNVGQFLQNNRLDGGTELGRVGRYLWRRTIPLTSQEVNEWTRYSLDVTDLVRDNPGGLLRLTVSINRSNSSYNCSEAENEIPPTPPPAATSLDDNDANQVSSWDYWQTYYATNDNSTWRDRDNPCKDAYYQYAEGVRASRNFLASNIGMVAKYDESGEVLVATTDLQTAAPMSDVRVTFLNFQDQPVGRIVTDRTGVGRARLDGVPFYALANHDADRGYLKMSAGTALPTSHFDVGGATVTSGLKGFIYGERGVWRPGDDVHLTFVLEDQGAGLPRNHPVSMHLTNPSGQRVQSLTASAGVGGFYAFAMRTDDDAPTGTWVAAAEVGGSRFTKPLKIETVIPNRLKVELTLEEEESLGADAPLQGNLLGEWLHGAVGRNLRADVQVQLAPTTTQFDRFADFVFDDPARDFEGEPETVFDGTLDASGRATFQRNLRPAGAPPGMLSAQFTTRVFENSGAFSTNVRSVPFSPYERYVGVQLPPGDAARGMLLTDTTHVVQIATLTRDGDTVSADDIELSLYKIDWRWWWDRSGESLAQYATADHRSIVDTGRTSTSGGTGTWEFQINYPAWGRYLLRACDPAGGHCAGKVLYIDWPGWAGRARETPGAGANVLSFFADRETYTVGDVARVQLPEASQGRALVTIENGTGILEHRWIEFTEGRTQFDVPITRQMSPNVYVGITLIQPHAGRTNDRPIRLYGVIPLAVTDPATRLQPVITAADEWRPESAVSVEVSEATGRPMNYTVAVVDEGLLGLTSFRTPDLHRHFYQKEALGVTTWDIFDEVVGAYGGELERLLALGGGGEAEGELSPAEESRFPPVVRFLGPFHLEGGRTAAHDVTLPQYIGAVRVMVVAGHEGAYGSAAKTVVVRDPLALLATVPRVVGPDEELTIPLALFATDQSIRNATVRVEADDHFEIVGNSTTTVEFERSTEALAFLRLRSRTQLGRGRLRFVATSGQFTSRSEISLEVRSPNPITVANVRRQLAPNENWSTVVAPHGLAGTNSVSLELTTLPPLNLESRLRYLIRFPHGCVEQVTSAAFPQLYLTSLIRMEPDARETAAANIRTAIDRLRGFQISTGAFVYWPGGFAPEVFRARNNWATNYVGHFLLEAAKLGHYVGADMLSDWTNYQRSAAQSWVRNDGASPMDQAYRLYTLALAGRPEVGAMNRLRESGDLPSIARWQLAAAYRLAGQPDVASDIVRDADLQVTEYEQPGWSFGSRLRDRAVILASLVTLDRRGDAEAMALDISDDLYSDRWHHTHGVAYALLAMAKFYGAANTGESFSFDLSEGITSAEPHSSAEPVFSTELPALADEGGNLQITNTSGRPLYASLVTRGIPPAGEERAASAGLRVQVRYDDPDDRPIDVTELDQGTDFVATVTVTNTTRRDVENVALTQMVPSGWEIHNPRLAGDRPGLEVPFDYQDIRDDRLLTYFGLKAGQSVTLSVLLNATYLGRYYMPSVSAEAMYDATITGRTAGQWISVVASSR